MVALLLHGVKIITESCFWTESLRGTFRKNRLRVGLSINSARSSVSSAKSSFLLPRAWNVLTFSRMRARIYVKAQKWRSIVSSSTPVRISLAFWCWTARNWPKFSQLCPRRSSSRGNQRGHLCLYASVIKRAILPRLRFPPSAVAGCYCLCCRALFRSLSNGGHEAVLPADWRGQVIFQLVNIACFL